MSKLTNSQSSFKSNTNIPHHIVKCLSDEMISKLNEVLQQGMKPNDLANMIEKNVMNHRMSQMNDISEKIQEKVELQEFIHKVKRKGNEFHYMKCVNIEGSFYPIETKICKSEGQCRMWLRLKHIKLDF